MLRNGVSLSTYLSRRRTEWSPPSTGVPAASAFNQPGAIAVRLSEVVEHLRSHAGTRVDSMVKTTP
jgi:hypothetical protein